MRIDRMSNRNKRVIFWASMPFFAWSSARVLDAYLQMSMEASDSYMSLAWQLMPLIIMIAGIILICMELQFQWKKSACG